jgi:hypothetical protein
MLIGLNALRTNREKSAVLNAWFDGEEEKPATQPVTVPKHNFASVEIRASFRSLTRKQTTVPSLPRHAQQNAPRPVQAVQAQYGLLQQFASTDCLVDMSMTPDGGMSAVLRSPYGYRRTVVCRPDGSVSQRITGPQGEEIVRFNNDGDPVHSYNKAQPVLQIA